MNTTWILLRNLKKGKFIYTMFPGTIDIIQLYPDEINGALEVMRKGFFIHENVCVAVELPQNPQAIKELEDLCLHVAKDGVSVIAVERATGIVAGAAFNKLQVHLFVFR